MKCFVIELFISNVEIVKMYDIKQMISIYEITHFEVIINKHMNKYT